MKQYVRVPSKRFRRDLRRLKKAGYDLSKLEEVIDVLVKGNHLSPKYKDHELKGEFAGIRECHLSPDWLLLYKKEEKELLLLLMRTGTHRDTLGRE